MNFMKLRERLNKLVLLRKLNNCENCRNDFSCEIGLKGCWCSEIKISDETREYLRQKYKSCLCRTCLETIEAEVSQNTKS